MIQGMIRSSAPIDHDRHFTAFDQQSRDYTPPPCSLHIDEHATRMGITTLQTTTANNEPGSQWGYVKDENNEKGTTERLLKKLNEPQSSVPNILEERKMA